MAKYECNLPFRLLHKARQEINENPELRGEQLADLASRLESRPDLPFLKDEKFLLRFLRARKFDLEKAFELIVGYYEAKRDNPDLFTDFNPSAERVVYESGFNCVLPQRDVDGCRIFYLRPVRWDPDVWKMQRNFRANLMALDYILEEEETQIAGLVIIADMSGVGGKHAKHLSPMGFTKYFKIMHHCYPVRIKNIHIMEQPTFFTIIHGIIQPFMREKLKKRFLLHGSDRSKVLKYIDAKVLPSELGGELGEVDVTQWVNTMLQAEENHGYLWN